MFNFEFLLTAKTDSLLPPFTGHLLRAAILKNLAEFDEELAAKLHEGNKIRPYSLSPLYPVEKRFKRTRRGEIIVEKEYHMKFRLGMLTQELSERMVKITLQKEEMLIKLANEDFGVLSIEIKKKSAKDLFMEKEKQPNSFSLTFRTPTYFNISSQEFPLRFPDPRYLYMNLASLWNEFYSEEIMVDQQEFFSWLENHVSINAYNLRTKTAYIAKGAPKIGFKGWVRYQLSGDESYQKWVHILSEFAEFSNVGANRTAGLGCVTYASR